MCGRSEGNASVLGARRKRNRDDDSPTCLETPVEPTFVTILKMNQDGGRMKKNT